MLSTAALAVPGRAQPLAFKLAPGNSPALDSRPAGPMPVSDEFALILTPTLNRRAMLGEALQSVAAQGWPKVQHIIADGGSSDGTLEWLAGREALVLGGPDAGIYDGLNRAAGAADGDIIGWLNSDDQYAAGALAAAAAAFARDDGLAALCGAALIERAGRVERIYAGQDIADLSPGAVLIGPTLPNAWFFRRAAFMAAGPFSTALRFAADGDFMMRFGRLGLRHGHVDDLVYRYRRHEGSATISDAASRALREDMLARAKLAWRCALARRARSKALPRRLGLALRRASKRRRRGTTRAAPAAWSVGFGQAAHRSAPAPPPRGQAV